MVSKCASNVADMLLSCGAVIACRHLPHAQMFLRWEGEPNKARHLAWVGMLIWKRESCCSTETGQQLPVDKDSEQVQHPLAADQK